MKFENLKNAASGGAYSSSTGIPGFIKVGVVLFIIIIALFIQPFRFTVVDSAEIGILFHKWSSDNTQRGGVEGTCKGWIFYNSWTTDVFRYPTYIQRKNYSAFNVNANDASIFTMDPQIAYRIDEAKACDIFVKYREGISELESGYIHTCIYEAYRTCANKYSSDSLMSHRAEFEADVRARLDKSLREEGFIVEEFTSAITPPASLAAMIDSKNQAVQAALKAENQVKEAEANAKIAIAEAKGKAEAMKIKADGEAYYNRAIAASLSPLIVQEDWIEKWDGKLPSTMSSGSGSNLFLGLGK